MAYKYWILHDGSDGLLRDNYEEFSFETMAEWQAFVQGVHAAKDKDASFITFSAEEELIDHIAECLEDHQEESQKSFVTQEALDEAHKAVEHYHNLLEKE